MDQLECEALQKYFRYEYFFPGMFSFNESLRHMYENGQYKTGYDVLDYPKNIDRDSDYLLMYRLAIAQSPLVLSNRKFTMHFKAEGELITNENFLVRLFKICLVRFLVA